MRVPIEIAAYLADVEQLTRAAVGEDLVGIWLIGSAAQDAYDHGVSDVDVLAVTERRWGAARRQGLGERLVHPNLPSPTAGLEFVWYALPDLVDLAGPVQFQLNVNGGLDRASVIQLGPDDHPNYWSVLDLAAARCVGVPLGDSPGSGGRDPGAAGGPRPCSRPRVGRLARGPGRRLSQPGAQSRPHDAAAGGGSVGVEDGWRSTGPGPAPRVGAGHRRGAARPLRETLDGPGRGRTRQPRAASRPRLEVCGHRHEQPAATQGVGSAAPGSCRLVGREHVRMLFAFRRAAVTSGAVVG